LTALQMPYSLRLTFPRLGKEVDGTSNSLPRVRSASRPLVAERGVSTIDEGGRTNA
jgi:hypothetical protein